MGVKVYYQLQVGNNFYSGPPVWHRLRGLLQDVIARYAANHYPVKARIISNSLTEIEKLPGWRRRVDALHTLWNKNGINKSYNLRIVKMNNWRRTLMFYEAKLRFGRGPKRARK